MLSGPASPQAGAGKTSRQISRTEGLDKEGEVPVLRGGDAQEREDRGGNVQFLAHFDSGIASR